ncbi:MAG: 16S rRNA (guanine(966)-N(2))-methyltransferase RsmD [Dethiobacter sp.]|nr:16S rRNA (guanine(966)-N(2))-methyltransferase RsmD [Dethiobacter sp.]
MRVIAGSARGRKLKTRRGTETRPTADRVKESLFNILAPRLMGCSFLDVFAGTGGIGIEALSRGAACCVFIEKNLQCVKIIKENLSLTGFADSTRVIPQEVRIALSELAAGDKPFDIIFLDPPYHSPELLPVINQVCREGLLKPGGLLVVEHHFKDTFWMSQAWEIMREKRYGDTGVSFLTPADKGGREILPNGEE